MGHTKYMKSHIFPLLLSSAFFLYSQITAAQACHTGAEYIPNYHMQQYDKLLTQQIKKTASLSSQKEKLHQLSAAFLNTPYKLFPTGEGKNSLFDQAPLYRADYFDCMTYVITVLALLNAHNLKSFQQNIVKINYQKNKVHFVSRNHFTISDFNPHNRKIGLLRDITSRLKNNQGNSVAQWIDFHTDKAAWLANLPTSRLQQLHCPSLQKTQILQANLKNYAKTASVQNGWLDYIPLRGALFNQSGEANLLLFKQIPDGAIVEIVRKDTPPLPNVYVSHLGFAIKTKKGLQFREASSVANKVIDFPLIAYLRSYLPNQNFIGIHLELPTQLA